MNIPHYFILGLPCKMPVNQLQHFLAEQLHEMARIVTDAPDTFEASVRRLVELANVAHPRCRTEKVHVYPSHCVVENTYPERIEIGRFYVFDIHPVRKVLTHQTTYAHGAA